MRKAVEFSESDFYPGIQFVRQIEVKSNLKNGGNAVSPVVIAMSIDGVKLAFLLHKTADVQTKVLLGDPCHGSEFSLTGARIPFPANANWANHPHYQKGCKVSTLSLAFNQVNVKVEIEVVESLSIGWLAVDNPQGGSVVGTMGNAPAFSSPVFVDRGNKAALDVLIANMEKCNPNNAIAAFLSWGAGQGYLTFDKEAEKVLKRKPKVDKKLALEEAQRIITEQGQLIRETFPKQADVWLADAMEWLQKYGTELPFTTPDSNPVSEDEIRGAV